MKLAALLTIILSGWVDGFRGLALRNGKSKSGFSMATSSGSTLPPSARKELFFDIVESGLYAKFTPVELERVTKFISFARGSAKMPDVDREALHDPCEEFITGLTAKPWWDASLPEFSAWVPALSDATPIIRRELESVLAQEAESTFKADSNYQQTMGKGWTAFRLQRLGEWNDENSTRFPQTTRLIQALPIPLAVRGVMFAKQEPNSGVAAHSDGRNFILTAHVGLNVPTGCSITVGRETKTWVENGVIIFDTSFTHETSNPTDTERYVLIIDFWHPELSAAEREALQLVYKWRNQFESGKVKDIDAPWVKEGKPLTTQAYIDSKKGIGAKIATFFSDGGLIKFNPIR